MTSRCRAGLSICQLVLSGGRKGCATVLAELWDQCRRLGVELPQPQPVAISSIAKARARMHEDAFRDLHREILARDPHDPNWNGRWSIEELYKISKHTIKLEAFHGRSKRGVRQGPQATTLDQLSGR